MYPVSAASRLKRLSLIVGLSSIATFVSAQNIFTNDMQLKSDLDWLKTQGVIQTSTSTWPLTANEIERALLQAGAHTPQQQQIIQSIRDTLDKRPKPLVTTQVGAYAQTERDALPQTFADDKTAQLATRLSADLSEDNWEVNVRVNAKEDDLVDDDSLSFEGSYLAGTYANQWLMFGQIPTWWGPGNDGSLIRGDASKPVVGFTMQRDVQTVPTLPYLNMIGPWQYQLFAGQLEDYEAVPNTKLFGMRLTAQPTDWLEVGASRMTMWGGDGRSNDLSSFWDAFTGTNDNSGNPDSDPGNQLGGFDARVNLAPLTQLPVGIYGQYTGEDEAGGLPAKNMYLGGIDFASSFELGNAEIMPYQVYTEYTDTRSSGDAKGISYNHYIYKDGYYQHGYPLGYALGGDALSVVLGGKLWVDKQNFVNAKLQHAKVNQSSVSNNRAFPVSDKLTVLDVAWEHQLNPKTTISSRAWVSDSDIHSTDIGGGIGIEYTNF